MKQYRNYTTLSAGLSCAWLALLCTACGTNDPAAATGSIEQGPKAESLEVAPVRESQAAPVQSRAPLAAYSQEHLVLKLARVPESLVGSDVRDRAWTDWLQSKLGESVSVESARSLRRTVAPSAGSSLVVKVKANSYETLHAAVERAASDPHIETAEIDAVWEATQVDPNTAPYSSQWHLGAIAANQAWASTMGSSDVIVAVLDSGLDVDHPDIASSLWQNPGEVADGTDTDGNQYVDDVNGYDFYHNAADVSDEIGHGTHVTGLIAGDGLGAYGVAPGVKIMPLRVGVAGFSAAAVAEAIFYAVDHGADVINMSIAGPVSIAAVGEAIAYAASNDVLLVAAAGNQGHDRYQYPAVYQDVMAVASVQEGGASANDSSFGAWVDISAPGQGVFSLDIDGEYRVLSGTSQASPLVAGVAALVKSAHPDWTARQIRTQLMASASEHSPANAEYAGRIGAGVLNAELAVGPAITAPRAYVMGSSLGELVGDADQSVESGESALLDVSLRFSSAGEGAVATLVSADPWISVLGAPVVLETVEDSVSVAQFEVQVHAAAPADHQATLQVEIAALDGTPSLSLPVKVAVAPSYRAHFLPFGFEQQLIELPQGGHLFVSDRSYVEASLPLEYQSLKQEVYAAFRLADGSFTPSVVLSNTSHRSRRPEALVMPNGDVHVVFTEVVAIDQGGGEAASFPAHAFYDAVSESWSTASLVLNGDFINAREERTLSLALDDAGVPHLAFAGLRGVQVLQWSGAAWQMVASLPVASSEDHEVKLVNDAEGLAVLAVAFANRHNSAAAPDYLAPVTISRRDAGIWSGWQEIQPVGANELAQLPFESGGGVQRYYQPAGSSELRLAQLSGLAWIDAGQVASSLDAFHARRGVGATTMNSGESVYLESILGSRALGSTRQLTVGSQTIQLAGDTIRRADSPKLFVEADDTIHAFTREVIPSADGLWWYDQGVSTNYFSSADVPASALPSIPVVVDDGATTDNAESVHASWSSSHSTGIASYFVAWGTHPGGADLIPWHETTATESTLGLHYKRRLRAGQKVFASVRARANGVLSSAIGSSDGIVLESPAACDDGAQNGDETDVDCGGSCDACEVETSCTCASGCDAVIPASVGLTVNGATNACYFIAGDLGSYINGWNNGSVDLNGVDITNTWVSSYPTPIDGGYYLHLVSDVAWAHLEVR